MRRIFITGASSGIGAALALYYAKRGDQLALVGRREAVLRALRDSLPVPAGNEGGEGQVVDDSTRSFSDEHGDGQVVAGLNRPFRDEHGEDASQASTQTFTHRIYVLDVRDRQALHAAAHDFLRDGPVDIVIGCAGISVGTLTEELDDFQVFEAVVATNLTATVATFEPFVAAMKQRGQGVLVGVSSVAAVRGLPGAGAYSASKAAVRAYCESLRVELGPSGVKVVTLAPGFIQTPMTAHNPYKMPFLMPVGVFAAKAAQAIDRGVSYKVIPWQMGWVARLLRLVPDWLYDRVAVRRKRKPRSPAK
ncbi:SDR family oxidoreductase [Pusillimonas sp. ANT_WB101]|uniref:SDR family oxidoreductase n=1 Tax=Pusillimonas sp. ANT_WB101 TaxID=2597356 RepID=UPI0011ECB1E5|nr:SDR family oxidoreductase [Pusillimonas sp. ANT_WB101]KAA0890173.1 SDR family oxidoreductase [Pusillimonas sp. ANT_WB101]